METTHVSEVAGVEQVERILSSHHFRSSKRCCAFLRHVVLHTCSGRLEMLKERSLGIEVFHRSPSYDTNQDPVVRTTAGEVRKRLAQYYLEPEHAGELRISLPPGTYVAEFEQPAEKSAVSGRRGHWKPLLAVGGLIVLLAAVALAFRLGGPSQSALEQFWAPVLNSNSHVVLCLGQPQVFDFTAKTQQGLYDRFDKSPETPRNTGDVIDNVPVDDIIPMWDRYVVLGDAQAVASLSAFFARRDKPFDVRGVRNTSLGDIRGKPSVLVGAFNNPWTLNLTANLRFYFVGDPQHGRLSIRDRQGGDKNRWSIADSWPKWEGPEDYAIVTRFHDPTTESTIVVGAGLAQFGTIAATEFLTHESYIEEAVKQAPADWADGNFQVVLSTKVIDGESGPPTVEAVHCWK